MPIVSGGSGGGSSGALTLLSTTTLGAPGTIDVSGINQSYNDLFLVIIARGTNVSASDGIMIRFNNDSGANYDYQNNEVATTVLNASRVSAATSIRCGVVVAASGTAGYFGQMECSILGYAGANIKAISTYTEGWESSTANANVEAPGGIWNSTAAINRITLLGQSTANLATGSLLRIYGRL